MVIHIPDQVLDSLQLSEADLLLELAVALYSVQKLSFGKARELANMDWFSFRKILSSRNIPSHYDEQDFEADLEALNLLQK
jgi:predicted HTH domain antitoxin